MVNTAKFDVFRIRLARRVNGQAAIQRNRLEALRLAMFVQQVDSLLPPPSISHSMTA